MVDHVVFSNKYKRMFIYKEKGIGCSFFNYTQNKKFVRTEILSEFSILKQSTKVFPWGFEWEK